jgi:zinc protease
VIGSHEDLQAATLEDVKAFFRRYYVPNNVTLVIAGDINGLQAGQLVERWFSEIPRGADLAGRPEPANRPVGPVLTSAKRVKHQDRVELERLYIAWPTPSFYAPGDAELDILSHIVAGGKASRLYKILVYEKRLAQDVEAMQASMQLGSAFVITVTAKPGKKLDVIERIVHGELARLRKQPPTAEELARAKNQIESAFFHRMEHVDAKADLLNQYRFYVNEPGYLPRDLERYRRTTAQDVSRVAKEYLTNVSVTLETTPKTAGPGNSP